MPNGDANVDNLKALIESGLNGSLATAEGNHGKRKELEERFKALKAILVLYSTSTK